MLDGAPKKKEKEKESNENVEHKGTVACYGLPFRDLVTRAIDELN